MKKTFVFLGILLFLGVTFAASQPVPGKKFELGTSIAFFSVKADDSTSSTSYLTIPVRFGWFIWKGLEIEPEAQFFFPVSQDSGDTTYFLQARLTYNFKTAGKLIPFIGGGAGFGNGIPIFGMVEGSNDERTSVFDGVAGVKFLIGNIAALRAEYQFNRYTWKDTVSVASEHGNFHQVLVGLSIFF
jgi:opacity protein-like surface antigen